MESNLEAVEHAVWKEIGRSAEELRSCSREGSSVGDEAVAGQSGRVGVRSNVLSILREERIFIAEEARFGRLRPDEESVVVMG